MLPAAHFHCPTNDLSSAHGAGGGKPASFGAAARTAVAIWRRAASCAVSGAAGCTLAAAPRFKPRSRAIASAAWRPVTTACVVVRVRDIRLGLGLMGMAQGSREGPEASRCLDVVG